MTLKRCLVVLAVSAPLLASGCTKKRSARDEEDEPAKTITFRPGSGAGPAVLGTLPAVDRKTASNDLRNIWMLGMSDTSVPPPGSLEQFTDLRQGPSRVYNAVKEGHYVVCWKADRNKAGAIFAYWKDVPKEGGPVVLVDGSVIENMTPQQFQNTPKAGVVSQETPKDPKAGK